MALTNNTLGAIAANFSQAHYGLGVSTVTATASGTGNGTIAEDGGMIQFITVVSNNNAYIVTLPTPVVGTILVLTVALGHDYVLKANDPAAVAINGVSGATAQCDMGEGFTTFLACTSLTEWKGVQFGGAAAGAVNGITCYEPA